MAGRHGEHVLEHRRRTGDGATLDRPVRLGLMEGLVDLRFDVGEQPAVSFVVPRTADHEVLLEPLDGITEWP